jgi:hypothetical protein
VARTYGDDGSVSEKGETVDLPMFLTTDDFVAAAVGLRPQLDRMNEAGEGKRTPDLDTAFGKAMVKAFHGVDVVNIAYGDENYATQDPTMRTRIKSEALNN